MGISTSPSEFAGKLDRLSKALADPRNALTITGMEGKRIFAGAAGSIIGAKVAGARKAIGVRYIIKDNVLTITYTGPAHLVNNPTRPHRIEPRRSRGRRTRRRRGASALTIGGNVRAWANHPGTSGKGFAQKAKTQARATLPGVYARAQITDQLRRIFG